MSADDLAVEWDECRCYHDCHTCAQSGRWHQHGDDPCPVHWPEFTVTPTPGAPV